MDSYQLVIDDNMIQNIIDTNVNEALDLFSSKLIGYLFFLGLLPSLFIFNANIDYYSFKINGLHKLNVLLGVLIITTIMFFSFSKAYLSFIREHKIIRYYLNPLYYLYSTAHYLNAQIEPTNIGLTRLSHDAYIATNTQARKLIILVIGETARADRFSINGYWRNTNPLLAQETLVNLPHMYSCGTSTLTSLPCIFSSLNRKNYDAKIAYSTENVLDILQKTGVTVLWRDNNSDSKGVALRIPYQDYKIIDTNPICDSECRDEGMLVGLQSYINQVSTEHILIVLHQMGSHGPAYYKRYPRRFEQFKPSCQTNQLEQCSTAEINNAYDNTILYTDYFLSKVIHLLKQNSALFQTAMFYVSDHGESLGEKGIYLHGLPYFLAPDEQKHVAALFWFANNYPINIPALKKRVTQQYSHDHIFHTLLGLMNIKTAIYKQWMDILHDA
jgi:lipid A ethanolaminephosphotransferase